MIPFASFFDWLPCLRIPALIAVAGVATLMLGGWLEDAPFWQGVLAVAARVFFVVAVGWTLTTLVDLSLKRRMSRLQLGVADNLAARKMATRLDVLRRICVVVGAVATLAAALTVIPGVKQIGVSLFASAGIAGLAIGLAARPMLSNLIAGLQIAFTQPIRIEDAVVVENEWGWIEEIGLFYVVIRIWDWRRLVVPLSYFIEKPYQNWTRQSASIIGSVFWSVDHRAPIGAMREELRKICERSKLWDGNVVNLQVTEAGDMTLQVRALASSKTSPEAWDLRCFIREEMIAWLQREHPEALPRVRAETSGVEDADWRAKRPTPPPMASQAPERDESLTPPEGDVAMQN